MALITCHECGAQISDAATVCPQCGFPVAKSVTLQKTPACPETHLAKAILLTIFCCWPLGIPAIVNASGVTSAYVSGDYDQALQKSNQAAKWTKYALIAGIVFWILYIIALVVFALLEL